MAEREIIINVTAGTGLPPMGASAIALTEGPEWDQHVAVLRERSYQRHLAAGHISRYRGGLSR